MRFGALAICRCAESGDMSAFCGVRLKAAIPLPAPFLPFAEDRERVSGVRGGPGCAGR